MIGSYMNIFGIGSGLDSMWERLKQRFPTLADFDTIRDSSHTHHTLNTALIFGTVGCCFALLPQTSYAEAWGCGVVGGLIGYVIRERLWVWRPDPVQEWDGLMDVLVPMARLLPFALLCVAGVVPAWLVLAAQAMYGLEALGYTFLRPSGSLHYT